MNVDQMLKEIEALKKKVEELGCEYPKYMLAINKIPSEQYIVKFTESRKGTVVKSASNETHKVGKYSGNWIPHTDTNTWKEVSNPDELYDKDLIECWDNIDTHKRDVRFYDTKNLCTFNYRGKRNGIVFDYYRKLMPWEEAMFPWVEEARKTLGD